MNVGMEIALLPLDTRGQAEAQTLSLECGERGESTWSGPCFESLLYCHTGTALSAAGKGNVCKSLPPSDLWPEAAVQNSGQSQECSK